jgi:hypothetical protein
MGDRGAMDEKKQIGSCMGAEKEGGSAALDTAGIIVQGNAALTGKYLTGVQFAAPQVAEMQSNCIGKEFAQDGICPVSSMRFTGTMHALTFIHVVD